LKLAITRWYYFEPIVSCIINLALRVYLVGRTTLADLYEPSKLVVVRMGEYNTLVWLSVSVKPRRHEIEVGWPYEETLYAGDFVWLDA
jgi:hypothetical protein